MKADNNIISYSISDIGKLRKENQDSFFINNKKGIFILCDGMGGEKGGATASKIVTKYLPKVIENIFSDYAKNNGDKIHRLLKEIFINLNDFIREEGNKNSDLKGMGTTIVLGLFLNDNFYIAHCGDSRAYLFRNQNIERLTKDHSVVEILLELGHITPEQAKTHPARGQISKFIGMPGKAIPNINKITLQINDLILFCSDGLTNMLNDNEIQNILCEDSDLEKLANKLIEQANCKGGYDNITVILINKTGVYSNGN